MSRRIIFLDMDGVLANMHKAACEVHGRSLDRPTRWDYNLEWGLTVDQFWDPINACGESFWENLEPFPWAEDLVAMARRYGVMSIASAPSRHPACVAGKLRWLQRFFGKGFRDYVFTARKFYLAKPGAYLIDDSEDHIEQFNKAGGTGILFPQHWNEMRHSADNPLEAVRRTLEKETTL